MKSTRRRGNMNLFLIVLFFVPFQHQDLSQIESKLTNGTQRQWSKVDEDYIMGNSDCLPGGLIYTFTKTTNRLLVIKNCVDGRWVTTAHSWQLRFIDQEPILIIDNKLKYHIRFVGKKGSERLRLTDHGHSKALLTREIYFE